MALSGYQKQLSLLRFETEDPRAGRHDVADVEQNGSHHPVFGRLNDVLHFHGFEHDQRIGRFHPLALRDRYLDQCTGHRSGKAWSQTAMKTRASTSAIECRASHEIDAVLPGDVEPGLGRGRIEWEALTAFAHDRFQVALNTERYWVFIANRDPETVRPL